MPVPVPKRRSSPPPSISELKKRQVVAVQPLPTPTPTPQLMNGYANGHSNGVQVTPNGKTHRRRRSKKGSNGYLTPSSDEGSDEQHPHERREDQDEGDRPNTPSKQLHEITFDEWQGIMKRIVDEWEIPRKVLHSSIGTPNPPTSLNPI